MNDLTCRVMLVLLAGSCCAGCSRKGSEEENVRPRAVVQAAHVRVGGMVRDIAAPGAVQALREATVRATIAGNVVSVNALEGSRVGEGSVLATILSRESEVAIAGARRLVAMATTDEERSRAENELRVAESSATQAAIRAPFSGSISKRLASQGEMVAEGSDMFEIVDPSSCYFLASVPLQNASEVRPGMRAEITFPDLAGITVRGTVAGVNPSADPGSQTIGVRISLTPAQAAIRSGTFGTAKIELGRHFGVILVPQAAVFHDDELNRYTVMRIVDDSLAVLTDVGVGDSDSSSVEITSGLKPGDLVATVGSYGLPDSTLVTVENSPDSR